MTTLAQHSVPSSALLEPSPLESWNAARGEEAVGSILPCNGSRAWAEALVEQRPFADPQQLFAASDAVWTALPIDAWQQAFDSHPRIGETRAAAATAQSLRWSRGEQAAAKPDAATLAALALGNRAYEAKFGRLFIVCATGKSAAEMLALLEVRLRNDAETELQAAAEEQRKITQLRLRKWLGEPSPGPQGRR